MKTLEIRKKKFLREEEKLLYPYNMDANKGKTD